MNGTFRDDINREYYQPGEPEKGRDTLNAQNTGQ